MVEKQRGHIAVLDGYKNIYREKHQNLCCLPFFDLWLLIVALVFINFSYDNKNVFQSEIDGRQEFQCIWCVYAKEQPTGLFHEWPWSLQNARTKRGIARCTPWLVFVFLEINS